MQVEHSSSSPWLTVVIPSLSGERWIDVSLGSIAAEAPKGVEVLLIDGGPSSAAQDIARSYAGVLDLRIFDRPDLRSWQTKTNFGVEMARSEHVCWLGVDDVWLPGRAAATRGWIRLNPEAPLHLAPSAIIDEYGRRLGVWRCPLPVGAALKSGTVTERLLIQNFVAAPAPVFRRDAWLSCGGVDESLWYTADWDTWLKLAGQGPVHYHDSVTVGFRIHRDSLTVVGSRQAGDFANQMNIVLERHLPKLGASWDVERVARASVAVNAALACASAGKGRGLITAISQVLRLGPSGIHRYLRDSRLVDRVAPRLRARMTGTL
jgi:hypothetical protein